jgi:hypothetical protein
MSNVENVSPLSREAAGSTSRGAFPSMPVSPDGFDEAQSQRTPFGSVGLLFLLKSSNKPKQTPP